ncbi:efflux RND transporter periplasmic adaptor subunit [Ancylomarina salipaludis]|uniref:Efflux RND transporter periplasmic adaptor subunit n=1 Tax=Ancylomarina salipaludis TaxID=2501299 RepID=A0A4Q1JIQ1_9BACT|nr:efflux RND transporter periplasmic adaptor subunit [Ancylomarina salipaludis]RXQ89506.1 efflux RND transporter periplasmic adaptor subunit [Ancylomarina salipaludis]
MNKIYLIALGLSLSIISCKPSASSGHEGHEHGGHDHGEVAAETHDEHESQTLTLYSQETELFAEFHPLVAGQISEFLAHLTRLDSYKPYKKGKVAVTLIDKNGNAIRNTVDTPASPGIFTPSLQPKAAGLYTLLFEVDSKFGKERFVAKNIEVYANEEQAEEALEAQHKENQTKFLKEQAWKIDFGTEEVAYGFFNKVIKTTGELIASSNSEIRISAQSSGIIQMPSSDIVNGKTVKKGEAIFFISGRGLSDNSLTSRFINARSDYEKTSADFKRAEALRADQIISEKEFNEAKSNFEKAEVNYQLISKDYSAKGIKVSSPATGYICKVFVKEGEYVEKGQVIGIVDRDSKLILKADLYQKHLTQLSKIHSANFKLPYRNEIYNTTALGGKLIAYGRDIHEEDYTTPVYFEINKTPELFMGSYVDVYLQSESTRKLLSISKSAVLEDQSVFYVFVQTEGESYEKRFVSIGADNGKEIEITSGLKAGERVVSKGVYFVKLASLAGALPAHSHNH